MRKLKWEPAEEEYFLLDQFDRGKIYAGLSNNMGRVYLLTKLIAHWNFMFLYEYATTDGFVLFGTGHPDAKDAIRHFREHYGNVYEFDTAHEFFTWAAEMTA